MMTSGIWIWRKVPGLAGRYNDILYKCPISLPTQELLVYFGGDVQDMQEEMAKHEDSKNYLEWSLESTTNILSEHFPQNHILVVRPSRMTATPHAVYSCYDNFVKSDKYGVPTFCAMYNALKHLQGLLQMCLQHINTEVYKDTHQCNISETNLTLMGFSKGCVVLNQFLHEFHYFQRELMEDTEMNDFIKLIKNMWWLDGGHGGSKNTWIMSKEVLESLAKLKINIHVHVTPYQVEDMNRPWIRIEEACFCRTLQNLSAPIQRTLHFKNLRRSLKLHFDVLKAISSDTY